MALTILDAPLTITLEALQTGIQNQEDAGFQLVDLSKGTSAGVPLNLATFQERTENLGNIQLTPTPTGLFTSSNGNFSVDPALSASFVTQMADQALSVVLYCPIVSINGSDCSLAVLRHLQTPKRDLAGSNDALSQLLARARADVGVLSTANDSGTAHGNLGCADAVTRILHDELGYLLPKTLSTRQLYDELLSAGWQKVDLKTPGAVIVSPECPAMHGHTGIVGENGLIYSNSSDTGIWSQNWTIDKWQKHYARCGCHAFAPPQTDSFARRNRTEAQFQAT